jgi:hypothetical protein
MLTENTLMKKQLKSSSIIQSGDLEIKAITGKELIIPPSLMFGNEEISVNPS